VRDKSHKAQTDFSPLILGSVSWTSTTSHRRTTRSCRSRTCASAPTSRTTWWSWPVEELWVLLIFTFVLILRLWRVINLGWRHRTQTKSCTSQSSIVSFWENETI